MSKPTDYEVLASLVGHKIVGFRFDGEGEGTFSLVLDDKRTVFFSSSGDDATYTYVGVEEAV